MEKLDIKEFLEYFYKKLPFVLLTTLLAVLIGYVYMEYYQVPMYHGTTTIILVQKNDTSEDKSDITENDLSINEKLVSTYSEIITSRRVLSQVKDNLKLNTSIESLSKKITVTSVSGTPIIKIEVDNKSSKKAVEISNAIANVFKDEITQIYHLENVSIIDEAIIEKKPYNINVSKQMIIYTLIGLVISCTIVFLMYYFDDSIKNKKEIEEKINLPVIGEVPLEIKLTKKQKRKPKREKNQQKRKEKSKKTKKKKTEVKKKKTESKTTISKKKSNLNHSTKINEKKTTEKKTTEKKDKPTKISSTKKTTTQKPRTKTDNKTTEKKTTEKKEASTKISSTKKTTTQKPKAKTDNKTKTTKKVKSKKDKKEGEN